MSLYIDIELSLGLLLAELPSAHRQEIVERVSQIVRVELINAQFNEAKRVRNKKRSS